LLAILLAIDAVVLAVFLWPDEQPVYAKSVEAVVSDPSSNLGRVVRVGGELVSGSLVAYTNPCEFRFRLKPRAVEGEQPPVELGVSFAACSIPDSFREIEGRAQEVVVEGELHTSSDGEVTFWSALGRTLGWSGQSDFPQHELPALPDAHLDAKQVFAKVHGGAYEIRSGSPTRVHDGFVEFSQHPTVRPVPTIER
jgi:cytochrome c-type biogenesis protein CcmE